MESITTMRTRGTAMPSRGAARFAACVPALAPTHAGTGLTFVEATRTDDTQGNRPRGPAPV